MDSYYTSFIVNDSRFNSTDRIDGLEFLEPVTRQKVLSIIADAKANGIELMAFETYRSRERQVLLFNQGVTQLKNVGVHQYGLACDLVKSIGGEPSWKGDFSMLGMLAKSYGLIWGGDWGHPDIQHTFVDEVHVQRCSISRQASLFSSQWYPDDDYDPYDD